MIILNNNNKKNKNQEKKKKKKKNEMAVPLLHMQRLSLVLRMFSTYGLWCDVSKKKKKKQKKEKKEAHFALLSLWL